MATFARDKVRLQTVKYLDIFTDSRASANSLWQGGRRRAHFVKGGLPR